MERNDVQTFLETLPYAGYGWLRSESVRERLAEIAHQLHKCNKVPFA